MKAMIWLGLAVMVAGCGQPKIPIEVSSARDAQIERTKRAAQEDRARTSRAETDIYMSRSSKITGYETCVKEFALSTASTQPSRDEATISRAVQKCRAFEGQMAGSPAEEGFTPEKIAEVRHGAEVMAAAYIGLLRQGLVERPAVALAPPRGPQGPAPTAPARAEPKLDPFKDI